MLHRVVLGLLLVPSLSWAGDTVIPLKSAPPVAIAPLPDAGPLPDFLVPKPPGPPPSACRSMGEFSPTHDPTQALSALLACHHHDRLEDATSQLVLSRLLVAYDARRLNNPDQVAGVYMNLLRDGLMVIGRTRIERFLEHAERLGENQDYMTRLCSALHHLPAPTYAVDYLGPDAAHPVVLAQNAAAAQTAESSLLPAASDQEIWEQVINDACPAPGAPQ